MPYKVSDSKVLHKKDGRWVTKQTCRSPEAARRAMRLLNALDHGYEPSKPRKYVES